MAILTAIKAKNPDVLFFGGMDPQGAPMAKQMQSLGLKAKFLGGDGLQTTEFTKLAGSAAANVTASSPGLPIDSMPGGKAFRAKFTAKYGPIQTYAPYAYDAASAMIKAMEQAGSAEPAKVLAEIPRVRFAGITGEIGFDDRGDVLGGAITLYRVKDGKWVVVETVMSGAASAKQAGK
jgi:branched-chain amino acid transport system substrate-binding protein